MPAKQGWRFAQCLTAELPQESGTILMDCSLSCSREWEVGASLSCSREWEVGAGRGAERLLDADGGPLGGAAGRQSPHPRSHCRRRRRRRHPHSRVMAGTRPAAAA